MILIYIQQQNGGYSHQTWLEYIEPTKQISIGKLADVGWIFHCEELTMKNTIWSLTQVVADRTSSQALSYRPSLELMQISGGYLI